MNKIIKKISFVITSIGVILLLGGVISSVFFSEKIENTAIDATIARKCALFMIKTLNYYLIVYSHGE